MRKKGIKAGLLRPVTLFPFPSEELNRSAEKAKFIVSAELSNGQMIDDIKLTLLHKKTVYLISRMGGNLLSETFIASECEKIIRENQ
jgi:pyruvate/2-oxoacid:ferredoxin oxidoreductase alpha subunit